MGKELDEELIEATIRRVAEAANAAARAETEAVEAQGSAPAELNAAEAESQERRVESLVRRVADAKAARLIQPGPSSVFDGREATDAASEGVPRSVDDTEDLIEATIRRVAAAKAARSDDSSPAEPELEQGADSRPLNEPDLPGPAAVQPAVISLPRPELEPLIAARIGTPVREPDGLLQALRRDLDETRAALDALSLRVDGLFGIVHHPAPPALDRALPGQMDDDEQWDDSPTTPQLPMGQMPRPAIFRDGRSEAVAPGQPELEGEDDVVIDTRPIPKPLPPLHPEPRRGLDLLPRTYRVTVEDKRRGVDLVPLHRALLGMEGVRDMSLLSYSNGVAIVSLDTLDELIPDALCAAIARAMSREAKVEVHNEQTMVVKLAGD